MAFERVGSYAPLGVHDWRAFLRHKCEEHISVFLDYMLFAAYMCASHAVLLSLRLCFRVAHAEHICEVAPQSAVLQHGVYLAFLLWICKQNHMLHKLYSNGF